MPRSSLDTRASLLLRLHDAPDDTLAWEEFVRIYGRHVVRWCRRYGLQENDAQDVAQDVLVRFWQHAAAFEYDPQQRFRGYLRRIVTSVVSDRTRRRKAETLGRSEEVRQLLDSAPAHESGRLTIANERLYIKHPVLVEFISHGAIYARFGNLPAIGRGRSDRRTVRRRW